MTPDSPTLYGTVSRAVLVRVDQIVGDHKGLGDILTWGARAVPARKPKDIVTQDEYTHDVIMWFEEGAYLVYDVT